MNTELKLFKILATKLTQQKVAEILNVSQQEASKKINGENGIKLPQLAQLLDAAGVQLATNDDVVIPRDEYSALMTLSKKALRIDE